MHALGPKRGSQIVGSDTERLKAKNKKVITCLYGGLLHTQPHHLTILRNDANKDNSKFRSKSWWWGREYRRGENDLRQPARCTEFPIPHSNDLQQTSTPASGYGF